jgi:hypothetical protein
VEKIHACKNDCILYCVDEYKDLEKCPIYRLNRFNHRKDGGDDKNYNKRNGGPKKGVLVLFRHFSFEALVCKEKGGRIVAMSEAYAGCQTDKMSF